MDQKAKCGASDVLPWEAPGAYRRDCEPHRGDVLQLLGGVSLMLGCIGFISLGATAVVGFPLGLLVLYLARRDLAKMKVGNMDPHGESLTDSAWAQACCGALVSLAALALGALVMMAWVSLRYSGSFIQ